MKMTVEKMATTLRVTIVLFLLAYVVIAILYFEAKSHTTHSVQAQSQVQDDNSPIDIRCGERAKFVNGRCVAD